MPYKVVIAEDEWLIAAALRRQVESYGHTVVGTAGNGAEAVALCCSALPDVVLMDVQMPKMDGLQATQTLMGSCPTCIVIVTGKGKFDQLAEQAGAMGYVTKPLLSHQIPGLVQEARARFERFMAIRRDAHTPDEALQTWLPVQRALRQIMRSQGLAEPAAYEYLQQEAATRGQSLQAAAEAILAE